MPANALAGIPLHSRPRALVVREHQPLTGLHDDDERDLMRFTLAKPAGEEGRQRPIFVIRNGRLQAQNYVGIIETRRGTVIEILPKVDLSNDERGGHPAGLPNHAPGLAWSWSKRSYTALASAQSSASTCSRRSSICS